MTTIDRQTESSTKPKYLTDEYEVVKDGCTYRCRKFEYRGNVYESCYEVDPQQSFFEKHFRGRGIKPGDPGYEELVEYLDQFLIPRSETEAE